MQIEEIKNEDPVLDSDSIGNSCSKFKKDSFQCHFSFLLLLPLPIPFLL